MDKLSISQCEAWLRDGTAVTEDGRIVNSIVQQLLDTMRENEHLKKILGLSKIHVPLSNGDSDNG